MTETSQTTGGDVRQGGSRLHCLDGLRGVLAALVVLGHLAAFVGDAFPGWVLLQPGFRVPAFFALSGFVLYYGAASRDRVEMRTPFPTFLQKRVFRLLPAYYASLLLDIAGGDLLALSGLGGGGGVAMHDNAAFLWHLVLLHSWSDGLRYALNPPCWMLGYEWLLSLLLPLLLAAIRKAGWHGVLLGATVLLAPAFLEPVGRVIPPGFLFSFLIGMGAARAARRLPVDAVLVRLPAWRPGGERHAVTVGRLSLGGVFAAAGLCRLALDRDGLLPQDWVYATAGLATAALCLYLAYRPLGLAGRVLAAAPFRYLGRISYGLFLFHYPLLSYACWTCNHFGWKPMTPFWWTLFSLAMAASVGLAELSYQFLEISVMSGDTLSPLRRSLIRIDTGLRVFRRQWQGASL